MIARHFAPRDAVGMHEASVSLAQQRTCPTFGGPTIVVGHNAPHRRSIAKAYEENPLSPAYPSDLSAILEDRGPDLWVHGHTHMSFDYAVRRNDGADVHVVCNPRGYVGVENPKFDPTLLIEVS